MLRRRGIPLVLCTSKTRAEVAALWAELGSEHLAVIEDGAGLLVPSGLLPRVPLSTARRTAHGRLVPLTVPYARVRRVVRWLRRRTGGAVFGFGDATAAEIGRLTGLSEPAARRAARREFDEPFVVVREEARWRAVIRREAARRGLVVTHGGRFHHLHGPVDKGGAVRLVRRLLERAGGPVRLIGLGDSPLDLPLLTATDWPVIVPRPDGQPEAWLRRRLPHARVAPAPGPTGWNRAVLALIDSFARS